MRRTIQVVVRWTLGESESAGGLPLMGELAREKREEEGLSMVLAPDKSGMEESGSP